MPRTVVTVLILVLALALLPVPNGAATPSRAAVSAMRRPATAVEPSTEQLRSKALGFVASSPMAFEPNLGQAPAGVDFVGRNGSFAALVGPGGVELRFAEHPSGKSGPQSLPRTARFDAGSLRGAAPPLLVTAIGGNRKVIPVPTRELPGRTNYLLGNDPSKWRTNVRNYSAVEYRDVYPGIDWVFYGRGSDLEYDFIVAPNADPGAIRLAAGAGYRTTVAENGDLVARTGPFEIRHRSPIAYQLDHGVRRLVACDFTVGRAGDIGFRVGAYDPDRVLIIDPVLSYSVWLEPTVLGGSLGAGAVAVDASGCAYVAGTIDIGELPVVNAFQPTWGGNYDAYVLKVRADGTGLEYCTYLGGSGADVMRDIGVDSQGNAYIVGETGGVDFPGAANQDGGAFVAKLGALGDELLYVSRPSNPPQMTLTSIAVRGDGVLVATGSATSSAGDLPGALQPTHGASQTDGFLTKLDESGTTVFETYFGGNDEDSCQDVAIDAAGNAVFAGVTASPDFPVAGAYQPVNAGGQRDGFVAKVNAGGTAIVFSSYFGGSDFDDIHSVAVDGTGDVWICGLTLSLDMPMINAADATYGGNGDAFVAKIDASGASLLYSTFIGGALQDLGNAVAVTTDGSVYAAGVVLANDLPVVDPLQPVSRSQWPEFQGDIFIARFELSGGPFSYLTYLGGSGGEGGDVALTAYGPGCVYLTTFTTSPDFPVLDPFDPQSDGNGLVLVKISDSAPALSTPIGNDVVIESASTSVTFASVTSSGTTSVSTTLSPPAEPSGFVANSVYFEIDTTANVDGEITVTVPYNPTSVADPNVLRLYHYDSGMSAWVDITTSVDAVNHTISGVTTSLSPFVVGVPDCPPITSLGHAYVWVGLKNSDAVGIRFDLRAEVYVNGTLIGSGQLDSVPGGSSGFNNARLHDIPLVLDTSAMACAGSTLDVTLYVRNACAGSGKNSGTARLWYNDAAANTNVSVVIPGVAGGYYLHNAGVLAGVSGVGPRKSIDVSAGAKCSPFKTFATWSVTY